MKKLLTILGAVGLTATSASTIMAMAPATESKKNDQADAVILSNYIDNKETNVRAASTNSWNDINITSHASVPALGAHNTSNQSTKSRATAKIDWEDTIMNSRYVEARGKFEFGTKKPEELNRLLLKKKDDLSSTTMMVFEGEHTVDRWTLLGHQTSTIKITLTAAYNEVEGITSLTTTNTAYITKNHHSLDKSWTTSRLDSLTFLLGK